MTTKEINILNIRPNGVPLSYVEHGNKRVSIMIEPISEEIENAIDNSPRYYGEHIYNHPNGNIIKSKNIYMYGEIDFNNEDDLINIERFNLVGEKPYDNFVPSSFNYDKGSYTLINNILKGSPTRDPIKWFMYCHCLIGKPKRIIVYKYPNKCRL